MSLRRMLASFRSRLAAAVVCSPGAQAMTLEEAKASEFFRWFHLMQVKPETKSSGGPVRVFRPEGEKFRALAAVELSLGNHDRILNMRLILARSFIADPRASSFARDIAKSFLLFAASRDDASALKSLTDEIQFRDVPGPLLMRSGPPPLAPEPSSAFRAFSGEFSEAQFSLPGTVFTIRNRRDGSQAVLEIVADPPG